ncbi:UDP-N-acetylglucosamine--undecaprenyl-phosphate N-acetylglucosaminephosphotransferase [Pseudoalteromonas prydzensis]|uniref:UDP-N-acetylglucosamine--undecaprenyl-phosphate N-acetylglucosaminephosphotransferase n=1 Tax=Pseudoalteromonas prydzensis TaxID=182141 RepID=UPI003FD62DEA
MLIDFSFIFFFALASLFLLRRVARKIGLVDKPDERKKHSGNVPLVGGVAICITIVQYIYNNPSLLENSIVFITSISALTFIGALDDKFDLSVKLRILVQTLVSIAMVYYAGAELNVLGNIFGFGGITLGGFAVVVTVLAVAGSINAFNMVDGIDGLLGGLSVVTFGSLAILLGMSGESQLAYLCMLIVITMLPYIIMNLGLIGHKRKVFMGDAGSMMIGFTVIWLLIASSQPDQAAAIRPVTALWLIAVPLMDMVAIMFRRIKQGGSPFKPDREHLHHVCQTLGLSSRQTLAFICLIASLFAGIGIAGELLQVPEYYMFYGFMFLFSLYLIVLVNYCKIVNYIRARLSLPEIDFNIE